MASVETSEALAVAEGIAETEEALGMAAEAVASAVAPTAEAVALAEEYPGQAG